MTVLPSYIDPELWTDFLEGRNEMQKKAKVPFTQVAQKRILMKLMKMHDEGHDANQALEESICNGWRSVFPPKPQKQVQSIRVHQSFAQSDREAAMQRWESQTGEVHPDRMNNVVSPSYGLLSRSH